MENRIDLLGFHRLLQALEDRDVSIRLRLLGEPWTGFCRLILLSDSAMILQDPDDRRIIVNIRNVIEFELQRPVEGLTTNTCYEIAYA